MNLPYKIRISVYLTVATALIVLAAFLLIYGVANWTVIRNIDRDLALETQVHKDQISLVDGKIRFLHKDEWEEEEHSEVQFHPIFIEIVDSEGRQLDRSPNLGNLRLGFLEGHSSQERGFNQLLFNQEIRQMQIALKNNDRVEGYLLVATSFEEANSLLVNLRRILLVLYPLILFSLFLTMRYLAGKSIEPVDRITRMANLISQKNLNERIPLPENKDEIKALTVSINSLLERLEISMVREQQFTSDASHELRTPLAVLKGSLEVLVRKPRENEEYVSNIKSGLEIIDTLNGVIDQLLRLARAQKDAWDIHEIDLGSLVAEVTESIEKTEQRKISFSGQSHEPIYVHSNESSLFIILNNLLQNALKYSKADAEVLLNLSLEEGRTILEISDQGIGIEKDAIPKVFNPFFRGDSMELGKVKGSGLGLSIVKKLCDQLGIYIFLDSQKGIGTKVKLVFPEETGTLSQP